MESLRNGKGERCTDRPTRFDPSALVRLDETLAQLRAFRAEEFGEGRDLDLDYADIAAQLDILRSQSHQEY